MAYEVQEANGAYTKEDGHRDCNARAKAATDKALEMDENLPEAHSFWGSMKRFQEWDFAGLRGVVSAGNRAQPNFATAHQWYAEMLGAVGRSGEAEAEIEKAYELDPFSRAVIMNLGLRHLAAANDDAIAIFKRLIESEPDYPMSYSMLGTAYEEKGMFLEALEPTVQSGRAAKDRPPRSMRKGK